jgi:hypothetical protein
LRIVRCRENGTILQAEPQGIVIIRPFTGGAELHSSFQREHRPDWQFVNRSSIPDYVTVNSIRRCACKARKIGVGTVACLAGARPVPGLGRSPPKHSTHFFHSRDLFLQYPTSVLKSARRQLAARINSAEQVVHMGFSHPTQ